MASRVRAVAKQDVNDPHPGRAENIRVVALSLDKAAAKILRSVASSGKGYGQYVSRLIFEERARQEERAKYNAQAVLSN